MIDFRLVLFLFLLALFLYLYFNKTPSGYIYFSEVEEQHCPISECPGEDCMCVLGGPGNTWYFNATISE